MINRHRLITGFVKHQAAIATLETKIAATQENLRRLRTFMLPLFRDENLANLLRAEGFITAPASINGDDEMGLVRSQTNATKGNTPQMSEVSLGRWSGIRRQSARLRKQLGQATGANLEDSLMLTSLFCYLTSLLGNPSVWRYLSKHDPETLQKVELLAATVHQSTGDSGVAMNDPLWTFAKAKADLGQLMKAAVKDGPQAICIRGNPSVMVVSIKTWKALSRRDTADSPKRSLRAATRKRLSETTKPRWARAKKMGRREKKLA